MKENHKLKSDISTLQKGFDETSKFLKGQLSDYSLEEILTAVKEKRKLKKQLKRLEEMNGCPKCGKNTVKDISAPNGRVIKNCTNCDYYEVTKE